MSDSGGCSVEPDWGAGFRSRMTEARVPLRGMLELTSRCNLKCVHCYLGDQVQHHKQADLELDTAAVMRLIDELVAAGTLFLTITGGDPMMRKDFAEIYRYAKEQGLLVTVFCDAILVTDAILDLFREYPPRLIEVSIYGATPVTYEAVTQVRGSFEKAIRGIDRLIGIGARLSLKTVLMTVNKHELDQMRELAELRGLSFRFDGAIFPCLSGVEAGDPVELRLSAEDLVAAEMSNDSDRKRWAERFQRIQAEEEPDTLYGCQAGQTSFYIDPQGTASPCLMTVQYRHSMKGRSFQDVWDKDLAAIRSKPRAEGSCMSGDSRGACNHCPAFNFLETGDEEKESQYLHDLTRLRHASIIETINEDVAL